MILKTLNKNLAEVQPCPRKNWEMTPSKAIRLECKWCTGSIRGISCYSKICKLNNKSSVQGIQGQALSPLRRIKLHCMDCVETRQEVRDCTGKLLSEDRLCNLHQYRFGHNPKQKGIGNPRFAKKQQRNDMVLALKS